MNVTNPPDGPTDTRENACGLLWPIPTSAHVVWWLLAAVVFLNAIALISGVWILNESKRQHEQQAEVTTQNLVQDLDQSISGTVRTVDVTLRFVADELERALAQRRIDDQVIDAFVETARRRLPEVTAIRVTDAQGNVRWGTLVDRVVYTNYADRDFFIQHRDRPDNGLYVSKPLFGRITNVWLIAYTRRFNRPDGSFAGVITASIPVSYYTSLLSGRELGAHGSLVLRDSEMGLITRHPPLPGSAGTIGDRGYSTELAQLIQSGQTGATYHAARASDNLERTITYRRLAGAPFVLLAGVASEDYLQPWRRERDWTAAWLAVFFVVTSLSAWLLGRSWQRQSRVAQRLHEANQHLQSTLADLRLRDRALVATEEVGGLGTYSLDLKTGVYTTSPQLDAIFGLAPDYPRTVAGWFDVIHPDDRQIIRNYIDEEVKGRDQPYDKEYRIVRPSDGEIRWVYGLGRLDRDGTGLPVSITGAVQDITERKQLEATLRESEERFRSLTALSSDFYWETDREHRLTVRSEGTKTGTRSVFSFGPQLGKCRWETPYVSPDEAGWREHRAVLDAHHAFRDFEFSRRADEGTVRHISVSGEPLFDTSGAFQGYRGVGTDITERKRVAQELEASYQLLEQRVAQRTTELQLSNDELAAFSYSVSHDLRAPLRAIDGFSRLLEEEYGKELSAGAKAHLARIHRGVRRMDLLIEALLSLSRLSQQPMQSRRIDLTALVRRLCNDLATAEPQRRVEFRLANDVTAYATPDLLRVALQNLLGNAWKFTAHASPAVIEFGTEQTAEAEPAFFVRDNGVGFDMTYAQKLFAPFQRLHSEQEYQGTGIGLATVRRIIQRHGGRIWTVAEPGHGATFYFTLPEKIPLMEWNDSLKTGHGTIDSQHRKLVDMLNRLADAMATGEGRDLCDTVLDELIEYTQTHFAAEEQFMASHNYPKLAQHKAKHEALVKDVLAFKAKCDAGAMNLPISLLQFLKDWLTNHIKGTDKAMVAEIVAPPRT
jgi:hemerythrin-like metal-binding protein/PAS domain S-box-containing protein